MLFFLKHEKLELSLINDERCVFFEKHEKKAFFNFNACITLHKMVFFLNVDNNLHKMFGNNVKNDAFFNFTFCKTLA